MVSRITVQGHCNPETKEVLVELIEDDKIVRETIVHDKESYTDFVYNDQILIVREIEKKEI